MRLSEPAGGGPRERLRPREQERRELIRGVLAQLRVQRLRGHCVDAVARSLDLAPSTLRRWEARRARRTSLRRRRGPRRRKPTRAHRRNALRDALDDSRVGARTLRRRYPSLTRVEAERIRRRAAHLREIRGYALRWTRVGSVWAADYTRPPRRVEGRYPRVLLVRDLASGEQLAVEAAEHERAAHVAAVLERLFEEHGAPLVVKSDNGGPVIGGAVPGVLARWGVTALRSPPDTPSYNGACEAGVGSVKRGAEASASRLGRPGCWTLDDLEAARCHANLFGRPRGSPDVAPQERWDARRPVTLAERADFLAACRRARIREALHCGDEEFPASPADAATLERAAVSTVLADLQYLKFRRE